MFYVIGVLAILLALTGIWGKWQQHSKEVAEANLTACKTLTATLGSQIKEQNQAVETMKAESARRSAESAKALSKAEARAKTWDADAARLRAVLTARKPDELSCTAAWKEIRGQK